jgi:hypothetical protein
MGLSARLFNGGATVRLLSDTLIPELAERAVEAAGFVIPSGVTDL